MIMDIFSIAKTFASVESPFSSIPKSSATAIRVSEMIEQCVNDQPLQEDDQRGFDKERSFGSFMPVGDHSEQGTGGSAHEGEKEKHRFRDPAVMLFGPSFVETESEEGNQGGDEEKILHERTKVGIFREVWC